MFAASESNYADDLIRHVSPINLAAYLYANGWREEQSGQTATTASLWTFLASPDKQADDYYEVLLPLRTDFRDFPVRMSELFEVLQTVERRPLDAILDSLTITNSDVIELSIKGEKVDDGSISLSESVRLAQRSWDILQAAACAAAATTPRAAYSSRKPDRVKQYLEQVRAGQTRRGSYGVSILSPVAPELSASNDRLSSEDTEPFERRVLRYLFGSVQAVQSAAADAAARNTTQPFQEAISQGVSANLCEAIADLIDAGGDGFVMDCRWAVSRPIPKNVNSHIRVTRDIAPYIRAAAASFRHLSAIEDVEVRGFVEKLSRGKVAKSGKVTIVGTADGEPCRVQVTLNGTQYDEAITAHQKESTVVCFGVLERSGIGSATLRNPYEFHVEAI